MLFVSETVDALWASVGCSAGFQERSAVGVLLARRISIRCLHRTGRMVAGGDRTGVGSKASPKARESMRDTAILGIMYIGFVMDSLVN